MQDNNHEAQSERKTKIAQVNVHGVTKLCQTSNRRRRAYNKGEGSRAEIKRARAHLAGTGEVKDKK